jgi:probable F420-dependent oxidoreductase
MKFGIFLPSFLTDDARPGGNDIRDFARAAEDAGFDSVWITDHIVTARRFYRVSWLDALTTLAHVAAITDRVNLGTSILILPVRQPAVLAKELATLQWLSGGRYIYGVGTGWYGPEFEACGVHKHERGARTDEVLDATLALLAGPNVHFHGRYYDLDDVTVEPHLDPVPPVWVAGGSQLAHDTSPEFGGMHPNVLQRIARGDGWIARPTCPPDLIAKDLAEIRAARPPQRAPITVAHENFTWIEESTNRDAVITTQQARFRAVVSDERPWDYVEQVYMPGTIDDIQTKVQARVDVGVEYLMLHTLTADLNQVRLIAEHIVKPFRSSPQPAT